MEFRFQTRTVSRQFFTLLIWYLNFILPEVASTDIRFQKQSMFSSISRSLVASNSCEICCYQGLLMGFIVCLVVLQLYISSRVCQTFILICSVNREYLHEPGMGCAARNPPDGELHKGRRQGYLIFKISPSLHSLSLQVFNGCLLN